jgi:hypothetical protein
MQVDIKHNGSSITQYVTGYNREHKICTGIGTIELEVSKTIGVTFDPWDTIDIYENGDYRVRYYVSAVEKVIPEGIIKISGQDNSKRVADYFIPDSYTIEEPSTTRYWIEKFLDEVGVSYIFTTTSQGSIMSNFTGLGLRTAYEQLTELLQMSGWL